MITIKQTDKVGIQYQRNYISGQSVSYAIYDDAWQDANGGYNASNPANPLYIQELDLVTDPTGDTLLYPNFWGNKFRFTDANGSDRVGVVANMYVIDNLTGLGWIASNHGSLIHTYDDFFGAAGALKITYNDGLSYGYGDWFGANMKMVNNMMYFNNVNVSTWVLPRLRNVTNTFGTSTTYNSSPTNVMRIVPQSGYSYFYGKTIGILQSICRIHFK